MQKAFYLLAILTLFSIGCVSKTATIKKHFLLEDSLPKDVLKEYMQKTGLRDISNGSDSFEIRKWYPFYYSDSFPVCLERLYMENGALKGEYYIFSKKEDKLILTRSDMKDMRIEKYSLSAIPKRFYDSLYHGYNFSDVDSFSIQAIIKSKWTMFNTINYRNVFFEQATTSDYYGVFITDPNQLSGHFKGLDQYASFARFTYDSIWLRDSGFKKWAYDNLNRVYNFKPPVARSVLLAE